MQFVSTFEMLPSVVQNTPGPCGPSRLLCFLGSLKTHNYGVCRLREQFANGYCEVSVPWGGRENHLPTGGQDRARKAKHNSVVDTLGNREHGLGRQWLSGKTTTKIKRKSGARLPGFKSHQRLSWESWTSCKPSLCSVSLPLSQSEGEYSPEVSLEDDINEHVLDTWQSV